MQYTRDVICKIVIRNFDKRMLSIETIITFFSASVLLASAPGPDNIFVLTQSAMKGRGAGLIVMLGLCTGLIVHSCAVAFGIAVIFQTSLLAFSILKYAGALYLLYLAGKAFTSSPEQIGTESSDGPRFLQLYIRGIIMNITNPKVSIFFLAFLPQFADPDRGPIWLQMLMLGGLFIVSTCIVFGGVAIFAGTLGQIFRQSSRVQSILHKIAGTVFLGLALKLATVKR